MATFLAKELDHSPQELQFSAAYIYETLNNKPMEFQTLLFVKLKKLKLDISNV